MPFTSPWRLTLLVVGVALALTQHQYPLGAIFLALLAPQLLGARRRGARPLGAVPAPDISAEPASEPAVRLGSEIDVAALSHELKAPLVGILGLAQILTETDLDQEQRGLASRIVRSSENLHELLDALLGSTQAKAGAERAAIVIERKPVDLLRLRDDLVAPLRAGAREPRSEQEASAPRNVEVKSEVRLGGHRFLMGDPVRLQQIGRNLLNNALKFTESGEVVLRVTVVHGEEGPILRLSVADTGMGIAPHRLGAIFNRFEQANSGIRGRFGGSGLGLAIVKEITEAMGGELSVRSAVGIGTIFTADVPAAPLPEMAPAHAAQHASRGWAWRHAHRPPGPLPVLT